MASSWRTFQYVRGRSSRSGRRWPSNRQEIGLRAVVQAAQMKMWRSVISRCQWLQHSPPRLRRCGPKQSKSEIESARRTWAPDASASRLCERNATVEDLPGDHESADSRLLVHRRRKMRFQFLQDDGLNRLRDGLFRFSVLAIAEWPSDEVYGRLVKVDRRRLVCLPPVGGASFGTASSGTVCAISDCAGGKAVAIQVFGSGVGVGVGVRTGGRRSR